jgi:MFS family permease
LVPEDDYLDVAVFLGNPGGVFPAIILYLSSFYKRHTMQLRFSAMFSVTSLAGAFSGLLAAGIQNMDGIRGLPGWAWVFILVRSILTLISKKTLLSMECLGGIIHKCFWSPWNIPAPCYA